MKKRQTYPSKSPKVNPPWLQAYNAKLCSDEICYFTSIVPSKFSESNILKPFSSNFMIFLYIFNALQRETKIPVCNRLVRALTSRSQETPLGAEVHSPGQNALVALVGRAIVTMQSSS